MKKGMAVLLTLVMLLSLAACGNNSPAPAEETPAASEPSGEAPETVNYKIGVMTGTVSQNEEEYRAAENMQALFGDRIIITTYPDRFMQEQETTITNMMAMASDPDLQAIVMVQAVPGAAAAISRVREVRPDMLFILGTPGEDPDVIADYGDVIMQIDELARGAATAQQAKDMGAETLVHYSFPRHMSYEMLATRRDNMKAEAERLGLRFIEEDAPDPTSDAGVPGTQQFIMEDLPRKVAEYGTNTAFFGTNCSMMEPLIRQTMETGAIFPVQCCPSPYHALPSALGIGVPEDKSGDVDYILEQIGEKCDEAEMSGRVGTWTVPINMMYVEVGVKYAVEFLEGRTDGRVDADVLKSIMSDVAGGEVVLTNYGEYDHFFLNLGAPIVF